MPAWVPFDPIPIRLEGLGSWAATERPAVVGSAAESAGLAQAMAPAPHIAHHAPEARALVSIAGLPERLAGPF